MSTSSPTAFRSADIIIAIDFGTTFTGVAYVYSGGISEAPKDERSAKKTAEDVNVIKTWPNANLHYTEKTPTIIAYNTIPPTWGGAVKPQHEPQVSRFKLGLEPNVPRHYGYQADSEGQSIYGKHPDIPGKEAVDFTTDYLQCIRDFVHKKFLPKQFGAQFLSNQRISYIITVPAIWRDAAKALTRRAASLAFGISNDELILVPEPEAAALFCATTCEEVDLKDGDQFLVCDAGGGTVDLISYRILSRYPFEIQECSIGTGAACGAVYLDEGFEALLKEKLGRHVASIWTSKRAAEVAKYFDSGLKRNFNPYDSDCEANYEIPFTGAPDVDEIGLEAGYLMLKREEIQRVFDAIFNKILELIEKQIEDVKTRNNSSINTLFLVGGLGSNQYLGDFLQKKLKGNIQVMQPMSGYSAIMRGAVLNGLGLNLIKERLMRRSYGVTSHPVFVPGEHAVSRKFVDIDGTIRCRGVMNWYVTKGDRVTNGSIKERRFIANYKAKLFKRRGSLLYKSTLYTTEDDSPPKYKTRSVHILCEVTVDLRRLPKRAWKQCEGGQYYQAAYDIGLLFGPELIFKFMSEGRELESVTARYT